jgi:hypothetical protein
MKRDSERTGARPHGSVDMCSCLYCMGLHIGRPRSVLQICYLYGRKCADRGAAQWGFLFTSMDAQRASGCSSGCIETSGRVCDSDGKLMSANRSMILNDIRCAKFRETGRWACQATGVSEWGAHMGSCGTVRRWMKIGGELISWTDAVHVLSRGGGVEGASLTCAW